MQDEIRVTVVATGLNRQVATRPIVREPARETSVMPRPVKLVRNATTGDVEYANGIRSGSVHQGAAGRSFGSPEPSLSAAEPAAGINKERNDYLDIPAFLRRQAD
jgi:cell division protein FtsZ